MCQRTSSTTSGYGSVDRFGVLNSGTDESPTHAQVDVASGTSPYTLGFRKHLKSLTSNQSNGAGVTDYISMRYKFAHKILRIVVGIIPLQLAL